MFNMSTPDRLMTYADFQDLFATLLVSLLPLGTNRHRFHRIPDSFTNERAIRNLASLRFCQSNRMPDPKDKTRIITTTTTTTFSMAPEMAQNILLRFADARFIYVSGGVSTNQSQHDATPSTQQQIKVEHSSSPHFIPRLNSSLNPGSRIQARNQIWSLTPKGLKILERFCERNGITQPQIKRLFSRLNLSIHPSRHGLRRENIPLLNLERQPGSDRLHSDESTIRLIFRRFAGAKPSFFESLSEAENRTASHSPQPCPHHRTSPNLSGVPLTLLESSNRRMPQPCFSTFDALDWLLDACTLVDRSEALELLNHFLRFSLIEPYVSTSSKISSNSLTGMSLPTSFIITPVGQTIADWVSSATQQNYIDPIGSALSWEKPESNWQRMIAIVTDPAQRLRFREFLRETLCEENLAFFLEVTSFLNECLGLNQEIKHPFCTPLIQDEPTLCTLGSVSGFDGIAVYDPNQLREHLAAAYGLYNSYLAPGSPCELNLDHFLRSALAARMACTSIGPDTESMAKFLIEIVDLFDQARVAAGRLMAQDSVPKFLKECRQAIRDRAHE